MPEALATTKRKFHKLLDSRFGTPAAAAAPAANPSSAKPGATDSRTNLAEPAAKRIRSDASSASLSASLHKRNASTQSVASVRTVNNTSRTTAGHAPPQPTREPPNFSPWSHETFLTRLRTFSRVTVWHPKPDAVNDVEWAKRGWSCVDTNTVCCKGGCGQRVLVNVEPVVRRRQRTKEEHEGTLDAQEMAKTGDAGSEEAEEREDEDEEDSEELEHALVAKYSDMIVDGHADGCLWRQAGCKADIYRLPIVKSTVWQPGLRGQFTSLVKIAQSFQSVNLKPGDLKPSPEKLLADFPSTLLATAETTTPDEEDDDALESTINTPEVCAKALLIAMCGWRGVTESGTELLCCDACFQRVGLWMYQPDYKRSTLASDDDDEEQDHSLDLVDLHREHCPWRNVTTQSATGDYSGLPAWQIFHNVLSRYADEHRRRSKEQSALTRATPEADGGVVEDRGHADDGLELMPELTREETERLDKERTSRLKKLKKVFGFKTRVPPTS